MASRASCGAESAVLVTSSSRDHCGVTMDRHPVEPIETAKITRILVVQRDKITGIIYCYLSGALVHFYGNLLIIPGTIYIAYRSIKTSLKYDDKSINNKVNNTKSDTTLIYHHKIPIVHKH